MPLWEAGLLMQGGRCCKCPSSLLAYGETTADQLVLLAAAGARQQEDPKQQRGTRARCCSTCWPERWCQRQPWKAACLPLATRRTGRGNQERGPHGSCWRV